MHFVLLMFEKSLVTSTTLIPFDLNHKTILTNGNVFGTKNNYSESSLKNGRPNFITVVWNGQDEPLKKPKRKMEEQKVDMGYYNLSTPTHLKHMKLTVRTRLTTAPKYSVLWPSCQPDLADSGCAFDRSHSTTPDHNKTIIFSWKYFMCLIIQLQRNPSTNFRGVQKFLK